MLIVLVWNGFFFFLATKTINFFGYCTIHMKPIYTEFDGFISFLGLHGQMNGWKFSTIAKKLR